MEESLVIDDENRVELLSEDKFGAIEERQLAIINKLTHLKEMITVIHQRCMEEDQLVGSTLLPQLVSLIFRSHVTFCAQGSQAHVTCARMQSR